jgi:hypothetical protein
MARQLAVDYENGSKFYEINIYMTYNVPLMRNSLEIGKNRSTV